MTNNDRVSLRNRLQTLQADLWSKRSQRDTHWKKIAEYLFPVRPQFETTDVENRPDDRRNKSIIDNTATMASWTLRSGLHSGLTSPARPWMKLTTPDPGLARFRPVAEWLHQVTELMHSVFHLSNLYNALPVLYGDAGVFGTGAMAVLEDPGTGYAAPDLFRCYTFPVGSYAIGIDNRNQPTTFVRRQRMTVENVVEMFGGEKGQPLSRGKAVNWSTISDTVRGLYENHNFHAGVDICWIVAPNRDYSFSSAWGPSMFPFKSCHIELGSDSHKVLRESGFREFPVLTPRWFCNQDNIYGDECPGMWALGDTMQLQAEQRIKGQALQKMVFPPLQGPATLRSQKVSLLPGEITYADLREGRQGLSPVHEVKPDLSHFALEIQEVQQRINRAFMVNLFLMLTYGSQGSQPATAEEIRERHEEKLTALGPTLEMFGDELLDPMVDRVYAMMSRAGQIPPPPPDLEGVSLTVEYTSVLAQAQKLQEVARYDRFMATVMPIAQAFPEVGMAIKAREVVERYRDSLGVDPAVLRSEEEANAMLAAQQQQAQQMAMAEAAAKTGAAARDLSQAQFIEGDSALDRLAGR